jgi:electron transport complex, RnfABCDGE type, C subunit
MGIFKYKGGIHPREEKELSKDKEIIELWPKGELVFPLAQHIGAPAKVLVSVGEQVLRGQQLAAADGFVSAPIYSSVSGSVMAIEPRMSAQGSKVLSIVVENDGDYKEVAFAKPKPLHTLSKKDILESISAAGIVGMGGAGFPAHVKLSPKTPEEIEYVIVNAAECEPYITADYRRMLEHPKELVEGLKVVLQLFDKAKGIFAIEDNKRDCVNILKELTREEERIEVVALPTKYPQGGERQLVYATTGRMLNSAMLPADVGCVVNNVETLFAIHSAVIQGVPPMERITTVTGDAITSPGNFKVLFGTNQSELIEAAGGYRSAPTKVISGGPMMGTSMISVEVPVTKTTSCILCMTKDEVARYKTTPCINCGRCIEVCPSRLAPNRLVKLADRADTAEFVKCEGMECMECGCCSYICPAKIPLKQSIASMRKIVLENRRRQ